MNRRKGRGCIQIAAQREVLSFEKQAKKHAGGDLEGLLRL
jgi:hypothetical protein